MAAVAAPIIAAGVGGLLSSSGSKKAAKESSKGPQIPSQFQIPLALATNLINQGLTGQFGYGKSPFASPLTMLQEQGLSTIGSVLGNQGQLALDQALKQVQGVAATGLDPATFQVLSDQLAPFFSFQKERGIAGVREAQAQGGRFFGSGGVTAEGDFLANLEGQHAQQILPLALQSQALRLGAAQSIPGFLAAIQGLGAGALQGGEMERQARQQALPGSIIPFLASLMGSTPFYQPPIATNFLQSLGANVSSLAGSKAFLDLFSKIGGAPTVSSPSRAAEGFDPFSGGFY